MLTMIGSKIAVEPLIEPDRIGMIWIPEQAKARANQGIVKYIGPDVKDVQVGDYILFGGYVGTTIHLEDEGLLIIVEEPFVQVIIHDNTILEIPGLYYKAWTGEFFPATLESATTLMRDAFMKSPQFLAQLRNRKRAT